MQEDLEFLQASGTQEVLKVEVLVLLGPPGTEREVLSFIFKMFDLLSFDWNTANI